VTNLLFDTLCTCCTPTFSAEIRVFCQRKCKKVDGIIQRDVHASSAQKFLVGSPQLTVFYKQARKLDAKSSETNNEFAKYISDKKYKKYFWPWKIFLFSKHNHMKYSKNTRKSSVGRNEIRPVKNYFMSTLSVVW